MSATVVLATGGTGGHIYPALALAGRLQQHGVNVVLIGAEGGLEQTLSHDAGVSFIGVRSGKLDRQKPNPAELFRAVQGVVQARGHLKRLKADLVIGFGGFASLPAVAAAALTRTPLWLNEQNAWPGLVTRLFAGRAELVITSVAAAGKRIKSDRQVHIPYPVDERRPDRAAARAALGLPQEGTVALVMGGSQGSVALNDAVIKALAELGDEAPHTLHVTGPNNLEDVRRQHTGNPRHQLAGYVDGVLAFAAVDMALTRSGTGTLSMAAFHGVPLIMVPLPTSAENHQHHNALSLHEAGAGVLLPQVELDRLADEWRALLQPARLAAARAAIRAFSPSGALDEFTDAVMKRLENGTA